MISVGVLYLSILIYQVFKSQEQRRLNQYSDSSEFTDLSESDRRRADEEDSDYNSLPNTCSYIESQLYTPNQSVHSAEHNVGFFPMPA